MRNYQEEKLSLINSKRKKLATTNRVVWTLATIMYLLSLLFLWHLIDGSHLIAKQFGLIFLYFAYKSNIKRKEEYHQLVSDHFISRAIIKQDDDFELLKSVKNDETLIRDAAFFKVFDRLTQMSTFSGKYKNITFLATLVNAKRKRFWFRFLPKTIFCGYTIMILIDKPKYGAVILRPKKEKHDCGIPVSEKRRIKPRHDKITEAFRVYSNSVDEANKIITSSFASRLLKLEMQFPNAISLVISGEIVKLAINTKDYNLYPSIYKPLTVDTIKDYDRVTYLVKSITDELQLEQNIWI